MSYNLPSLYVHQVEHKDRVRAELVKHRAVIMHAPTGFGKTTVAKWLLATSANNETKANQSGRYLFAVHRRGLVDNAVERFDQDPKLPHGVLMSNREAATNWPVQVGSIDSLLSWFCEKGNYWWDVTFDLIIYDECVSGDAVVETDIGEMRLDDMPRFAPSRVKTYNTDRGVHFARILNWTRKGERPTIEIHTNVGKVRCTADHEIYTRRGWLQAQFVSDRDEILACVDAVSAHGMDVPFVGGTKKMPREGAWKECGTSFTAQRRSVRAGVGSPSGWHFGVWTSGCRTAANLCLTSMRTGTRGSLQTKHCDSLRRRSRRSSEPFSAIRRSAIQTKGVHRRASAARMGIARRSGRNTRPPSCTGSMPQLASRTMRGGERSRWSRQHRATRVSSAYTSSSYVATRRECRGNGLTGLATSVLHGGFVTTGQHARRRYSCTRKGFRVRRTISSPAGSVTISAKRRCAGTRRRIPISSTSPVGHKSRLAGESRSMSQSACGTNWFRVTRVDRVSPVDVYDIEVEGSHCFFANNLLVHNCHSHHSKLKTFLECHNRKREELGLHPPYVLGLTATPEAKGLSDVYQSIVLGPPKQWLIDNGYLCGFRYLRGTEGNFGLLIRRGKEFTENSICEAMGGLQGDLVRDWKKHAEGRPTVGFFPRLSHAMQARDMLDAAGVRVDYVDGSTDDEVRRQMFYRLNNGYLDYICNVGVIERGTDIPSIACIQLCTVIGSRVRFEQMVGRGSRTHPAKTECLVLDHGGSTRRLGYWEDEYTWTLDYTSEAAKEQGVRATIECPECQTLYRGGKCSHCGYEPTKRERKSQGLEFVGGELKEVSKKEQKAPTRIRSNEEILISSLYIAGARGGTWKTALALSFKAAKQQNTQFKVPKNFTVGGQSYKPVAYGDKVNSHRRVSALYPFTKKRGNS